MGLGCGSGFCPGFSGIEFALNWLWYTSVMRPEHASRRQTRLPSGPGQARSGEARGAVWPRGRLGIGLGLLLCGGRYGVTCPVGVGLVLSVPVKTFYENIP